MSPADLLRKRVRKKNKELDAQAKAEYSVGAVFAVFSLGGIFIGCYILGLLMESVNEVKGLRWAYAFGAGFAFAAIASLVSYLVVQPGRKVIPMEDADEVIELLKGATPASLFFQSAKEMPGMVGFLFGGPENILKGYGIQQNKVSTDPALLERSMKLLKRCEEGYPLSRMKNPEAAVLLRQLGLVRVERRDSGQTLVFTDDGRMLNDQQ